MKLSQLFLLGMLVVAVTAFYNFEDNAALRYDLTDCDNNPCGSSETCCVTPQGPGCCPNPGACCCPDKMHCCPSGYQCQCSGDVCTGCTQQGGSCV